MKKWILADKSGHRQCCLWRTGCCSWWNKEQGIGLYKACLGGVTHGKKGKIRTKLIIDVGNWHHIVNLLVTFDSNKADSDPKDNEKKKTEDISAFSFFDWAIIELLWSGLSFVIWVTFIAAAFLVLFVRLFVFIVGLSGRRNVNRLDWELFLVFCFCHWGLFLERINSGAFYRLEWMCV